MRLILLTLYLLHIGLSLDEKPGFRVQVSQKGINYVRDVLLPLATDAIKTAKISDTENRVDSPIGHITFKVYNAKVTEVDISQTSVKLGSPSDVVATIQNAVLAVNADWHYRKDHWPNLSDQGRVEITASEISINLDLRIGTTDKGEPHVTSESCTFDVGNVDVTFHGGWSWLYNLFSETLSDSLKEGIQGQVCPLITDEVNNDLNSILNTLELQSDIDENCYIDYSLIQPPFVTKEALFVNGKGEIFDKSDPKECPSPKQDMPETVDSERMVTLWITEYMLNTAGYAYQTAGFLQYNLTSDDIPSDNPIKFKLTTDFFKFFVPDLHKAYPDKNLTLWIYATKPVLFNINKAGVSGRAEGTITWLVHVNDTLVPAFTLDAQLDLCVNLSVQLGGKSEIYLDLITVEPYIQLRSSNIGNFSISTLQTFLKFSRGIIKDFANSNLKHGIPLPAIDHVNFSGFDFQLDDGYIRIHSDIEYDPDDKVSAEREHHTLFEGGFKFEMKNKESWKEIDDMIGSDFLKEMLA
ncbi:bactericidal permeability-increasing protein-like [Bolinopsis microptera]|uniref:bactericidal permeability-increasing protein-like n=1 Tax=Bolinopsis microptera TaxID=2820187 RepID=UPI003078BA6A